MKDRIEYIPSENFKSYWGFLLESFRYGSKWQHLLWGGGIGLYGVFFKTYTDEELAVSDFFSLFLVGIFVSIFIRVGQCLGKFKAVTVIDDGVVLQFEGRSYDKLIHRVVVYNPGMIQLELGDEEVKLLIPPEMVRGFCLKLEEMKVRSSKYFISWPMDREKEAVLKELNDLLIKQITLEEFKSSSTFYRKYVNSDNSLGLDFSNFQHFSFEKDREYEKQKLSQLEQFIEELKKEDIDKLKIEQITFS